MPHTGSFVFADTAACVAVPVAAGAEPCGGAVCVSEAGFVQANVRRRSETANAFLTPRIGADQRSFIQRERVKITAPWFDIHVKSAALATTFAGAAGEAKCPGCVDCGADAANHSRRR